MSPSTKRVLILGGYGAAGKAIAMQLSNRSTVTITIAGRSIDKAQACTEELRRESPVGTDFLAASVDVTDREQVARACEEQELVILACDTSLASLENVIRACVANGADYVDIAPDSRKLAVFESLATLIEAGQSRFVLDAGADPGLPGWLAQWLSQQAPEPLDQMQLFARYRSDEIGWSGVADILSASDSQGWVYDGHHWQRSSVWDFKWKRFTGGLGLSLCVPIRLDELESLPEKLGLHTFKCYHAGLNPVTDALMMLEGTALPRIISFETRQRMFFRALKRFTSRPFGLSIEAVGQGAGRRFRMAIGHADLYAATAIPAAVMSEFLLNDTNQSPGFGYLGDWASVHSTFLEDLRDEGFWFENEALS
ncbi:saccharopine dehydrogenase NADP-binding domain-containing protein [Marinobacteraceae bacterium S3BR75-40.1]